MIKIKKSSHHAIALIFFTVAYSGFILFMPKLIRAASCSTSEKTGTINTTVVIPASGEYILWARMQHQNQVQNSILVEVENDTCFSIGSISMPNNQWTWLNYQGSTTTNIIKYNFSTSGPKSVKFLFNDYTTKLDKMILLGVAEGCSSNGSKPLDNGSNCATAPSVSVNTTNTPTQYSSTIPSNIPPEEIQTIEFFLNGKLVQTSVGATQLDTTKIDDGNYELIAKVTKKDGTTEEVKQSIVIKDNQIAYQEPIPEMAVAPKRLNSLAVLATVFTLTILSAAAFILVKRYRFHKELYRLHHGLITEKSIYQPEKHIVTNQFLTDHHLAHYKIKRRNLKHLASIAIILVTANLLTLVVTAQTIRRYATIEPELGNVSGSGTSRVINDVTASNGKYIKFDAPAPIPTKNPEPPTPSRNCTVNYGDLTLSTPQKEQLTLYTTSSDRICIKSLTNVRLAVFGPYQYIWVGNMIYDASKTPGGAHRDGTWQKGGGDRAIYVRGCEVNQKPCNPVIKAGLMDVDNLEVYNSAEDGIQITNADITVNRFIMKNVWAGNTGIFSPALGSANDQSPHTDGVQALGKATIRINNFDWDTISWAGFIGHNETTSFGPGPIKVYLTNGKISNIGSNKLPTNIISGLQSRAASEGKSFQHVGGNGIRFYGKKASPLENLNEIHIDNVKLESSAGNGLWLGPDIKAWSVKNSTFYKGVKLYDGWTPPAPQLWSNNTIISPTTGYYKGP